MIKKTEREKKVVVQGLVATKPFKATRERKYLIERSFPLESTPRNDARLCTQLLFCRWRTLMLLPSKNIPQYLLIDPHRLIYSTSTRQLDFRFPQFLEIDLAP